MKLGKIVLIIILFTGFLFSTAEKQKSDTLSFKETLSLKSPSRVVMSPNGKYLLYRVSTTDWEKNKYLSQIWMAEIATNKVRQMTYSKGGSYSYKWSPDSNYISFKSKRDKYTQLYIMSATGGESKPITKFKTGFGSYAWSPDGKKIAYLATDEKTKKQKGVEKKYGKFDVIDEGFNMSHLWILDVKSGKIEKVTENEKYTISSFSWSPDSKKIAFAAVPDTRIPSFSKSDIYVIELKTKIISKIVDLKGPDGSPTWSWDGKTIAFTSKGTEAYFANTEICTIPADGGKITCLTKGFDENAGLMHFRKEGIYFSAPQGMNYHLFRLNPKTKKIIQLTKGNRRYIGISLSRNNNILGFTYRSATDYPEVYYTNLKKFKPKKLTNFSRQISKYKMATKEKINWKSKDGANITGVLIKPADFDPKKKYPLFVIIHGGPAGISYPQKFDTYNAYYPIEQWAAKGAVILEPNYRGSAGFGADFRKLNYRNLGVGDYWDVISGVDYLIDKGFVDKDRVSSMGWSQGGYISAYISTFSNRFKAVSVGAGISDWVTYYYRTDITPFTVHYLGSTPWKDPEVYKKTSPMTHINNAKTPTLIQHGEFDRRVPTTNAYKLYRGLQDRGIPSKLIIYKGFGHGISKPKEKLGVLTHNWNWFNKYIFGEEVQEETFEEEGKKDKD